MKRIPLQALLLLTGWICWTCANVRSPTGGPKDKTPPRLLSSIPPANQTNYTGTTILLTFDEPVRLNSPREEIIISPSPGKEIEYKVKNNRVFITPKTPWQDATTYSILFREGIQDITEGNSPVNLKLAFSTGPFIDSLVLAGQVTDVLLGTALERITVAIYAEDTFDIFSHVPKYFTKTDKRGSFQLENIKEGKYFIYAFDDKNRNLKVESRAEMFGFISNPIELNENVDTLNIGLIQLDSRPIKLSSIRDMGSVTRLRYSKSLFDYSLRTGDKEVVSAFGDNASEINIWNPVGPDSILIELSARDSINHVSDTTFYIKQSAVKPIQERFNASLGDAFINSDNGVMNVTISLSKPVSAFNYDSLYLKIDTTTLIPIGPEDATYLVMRKQLKVAKDLGKKMFGPDANPTITVMMKKAFLISQDGDTSRANSTPVTIYWPEENGVITIQANTRQENYVLQLLEASSHRVITQSVNNPRLVGRNIPPGDYSIRVILDTNANGRWDPGNPYTRVEPEKVIYYQAADGSRSIPVRANWEIGPLTFSF